MSVTPGVSIVVGLISGNPADLRRCLQALHAQTDVQSVEGTLDIVVPYDDPCAAVTALQTEFPQVRFIRAVGLDTAKARVGASREHHDTLRTIGLRAATGDVIVLTEDHAHAAPTWCAELLAGLDRHPKAAAMGGAVECDSDRQLNWAVWFCDFGRYQNPLPEGPAAFVSDSNVAYRRDALVAVAAAWRQDYHETAVHWAMQAAGYELCTTPRAVVWQARSGLSWSGALRERYVWARSFAGTRAGLIGARRFVLALLTPLLPLLMTWRLAATAIQRGRWTGRFLACLPLIILLQTVWAAGELVGYLTANPDASA